MLSSVTLYILQAVSFSQLLKTAVVWIVMQPGRLDRNSGDSSWNVMAHGDARRGSERETGECSGWPVLFTLPRNMVYPALLPLMRTPRLASNRLNWRPSANLNGLIRFAERRKFCFCACAITFQLVSTWTDFLASFFLPYLIYSSVSKFFKTFSLERLSRSFIGFLIMNFSYWRLWFYSEIYLGLGLSV